MSEQERPHTTVGNSGSPIEKWLPEVQFSIKHEELDEEKDEAVFALKWEARVIQEMTELIRAARKFFGESLRRAREAHGFSRLDIANESGLTPSYIGLVERGRVFVSLSSAVKLARAVETLVRRKEQRESGGGAA